MNTRAAVRCRWLASTRRRPVLITGGAGFIGTNLAHRLLAAGVPVLLFDNASRPGVVEGVVREFDGVELVRCDENRGAAGRNAGVARVRTPYVGFCDDDTWWAPGALARAADLLDTHRDVGAISACVLVGDDERVDPTCEAMAMSPLDSTGLPGPALFSFMAGAAVRVHATSSSK